MGAGLLSMIGMLGSSLLSGLGGLFSSRSAARQSAANIRRTIAAKKAMAKKAFMRNMKSWKMMRRYNAPVQQMARFREAGLNPNLIYGAGTPGNVGSYPVYHAPSISYRGQKPFNIGTAITATGQALRGGIKGLSDIRMNQANIDVAEQIAVNKNTLGYILSAKSVMKNWEKKRMRSVQNQFVNHKAEFSQKKFRSMLDSFSKMTLQKMYQKYANQIKKEKVRYAKQGMTLNDNIQWRALVGLINMIGNALGINTSALTDLTPNN